MMAAYFWPILAVCCATVFFAVRWRMSPWAVVASSTRAYLDALKRIHKRHKEQA